MSCRKFAIRLSRSFPLKRRPQLPPRRWNRGRRGLAWDPVSNKFTNSGGWHADARPSQYLHTYSRPVAPTMVHRDIRRKLFLPRISLPLTLSSSLSLSVVVPWVRGPLLLLLSWASWSQEGPPTQPILSEVSAN